MPNLWWWMGGVKVRGGGKAHYTGVTVTAVSSTGPTAGQYASYLALASRAHGDDVNVTQIAAWSVVNGTGTGAITQPGTMHALTAGSVTVRAQFGGFTGSLVVTIAAAPSAPTLTAISVTGTPPQIGATSPFFARGTYSDGSTADVTLTSTWTSTVTGKATIGSTTGIVTGVAAGDTTIRATIGGVHGDLPITIPQPPPPNPPTLVTIAVSGNAPAVSGTSQLIAAGTYSDGSVLNVTNSSTWTSSNLAAITVNSTGLTTGVAGGTSVLRATIGTVVGSLSLTVATPPSPPALTVITVTGSTPLVGNTSQMTAIGHYDDGSSANLTGSVAWASSNPGAATISGGGLVTGVAGGTTSITATSGPIVGTLVMTIPTPPPTLSAIAVTGAGVAVGSTAQWSAIGTYSDGSTLNLTTNLAVWTSLDVTKATVTSASGLVTGVGAGTTTIRATYQTVIGSAPITVASPPPIPQPLVILCPGNATGTSTTGAPVAVTYSPATSTGGVVPVTISYSRASGSLFPVGSTAVTATALDAIGTTTSCTFQVIVSFINPPPPIAAPWSIGYYTPFGRSFQSTGYPILADLDWGGVTHLAFVGATPQGDGSLVLTPNFATVVPAVISAARSHGVEVLLTLGNEGGGTYNFTGAINNHLATLVSNTMAVVTAYGFDGVDIDYESGYNATSIGLLLPAMRTALGSLLLTSAAFVTVSADYVSLVTYVDRVNLLTYGLSGPFDSESWFNAALFGPTPPGWTTVSVDLAVTRWLNAGIAAAKIGVGIPFYGVLSTGNGVTGPRQTLGSTFTEVGYNDIVSTYGTGGVTFDSQARVPWKAAGGGWINYNNEQSISETVTYVRNQSLGGWILWHIGWDYVPTASPKHPLLSATATALSRPTAYYVSPTGNNANPGTLALPKRTISAGCALLTPGSTLYVRAGTYNENLINNIPSGTAGSPVTIAAYPGETVWITPTTGTFIIGLYSGTHRYIVFNGINLDGRNLPPINGQNLVRLEDNTSAATDHITMQNAELIGAPGVNQFPGGPISIGVYNINIPGSVGTNTFQNLTIHGGGENGGFAYAFYVNTSNNLIENCLIYNVSGYGIQLYSGYSTQGTGNIIRNTVIRDIRRTHSPEGNLAAIANYLGSSRIYNNLFYNLGIVGHGRGIESVSSSAGIYNNTIYNCTDVGIYMVSGTGSIVRNNIAYGCAGGNYLDTATGTTQDHNDFAANPLFVNAAAGNFTVQDASPARNTGLPVSGAIMPAVAINGDLRPLGPQWDIGCYERA